MQRPCWVILNKKVFLILLAFIVVFLFIFSVNTIIKNRAVGKMPATEMLQIGLERTMDSDSFRYRLETKLSAEGQEDTSFFSSVEGERAAPGQISINGNIMHTPIQLIQLNDSSYFLDPSSGQWVALTENKLSDMEMFYAELNPLAYFDFKSVSALKSKGRVKVNGEKLLLIELSPLPRDPFLTLYLTDFSYKIWLDPADYRIRQAEIRAQDQSNPQSGMEISLGFWDYDKNISIIPPDVK